ncbi:hypothetical protein CcaCcLH18_08127 [Colletotrichum camelliae]|nr:hypothetical protein CcaCcLH18_08127 [Colletotrichum camelliae]
MTVKEFSHFDKHEYAKRVSEMSATELAKIEITKTRQLFASSFAGGACMATALPSHGLSLAVLPYHMRNGYLAQEKLEVVQAELRKRNIPLHDIQKRDILIPVVAGCAGIAVGVEISGISDVVAEGLQLHTPSTAATVGQMMHHSAETAHGALHGAVAQGAEMGHVVRDAVDPSYIPAGPHAFHVPCSDVPGWNSGIGLASLGERTGLSSLADQIVATGLASALSHGVVRDYGKHCSKCHDGIARGKYWHCNECNEAKVAYEICCACYDEDEKGHDHLMTRMKL